MGDIVALVKLSLPVTLKIRWYLEGRLPIVVTKEENFL